MLIAKIALTSLETTIQLGVNTHNAYRTNTVGIAHILDSVWKFNQPVGNTRERKLIESHIIVLSRYLCGILNGSACTVETL